MDTENDTTELEENVIPSMSQVVFLLPALKIILVFAIDVIFHYRACKLPIAGKFEKFTKSVIYFGVIYSFVFYSYNTTLLLIITSFFYAALFSAAVTLTKRLSFDTLNYAVKLAVVTYTVNIFKHIPPSDESFDQYIVIFTVLTVKLLGLVQDLKESWHLIYSNRVIVLAYFLFPGWISFWQFLAYPFRPSNAYRNAKIRHILLVMIRATLSSFTARLSAKILLVFGKKMNSKIIWAFLRGIQFRSNYYYLAQFAEIDGLPVGERSTDIYRAELGSLTIAEFFSHFTTLISGYVCKKIDLYQELDLFFDWLIIAYAVSTFNPAIALFSLCFILSMHIQKCAVGAYTTNSKEVVTVLWHSICPTFNHPCTFPPSKKSHWSKSRLIFLNHLRLIAIFCFPFNTFCFVFLGVLTILDLLQIVFCLYWGHTDCEILNKITVNSPPKRSMMPFGELRFPEL